MGLIGRISSKLGAIEGVVLAVAEGTAAGAMVVGLMRCALLGVPPDPVALAALAAVVLSASAQRRVGRLERDSYGPCDRGDGRGDSQDPVEQESGGLHAIASEEAAEPDPWAAKPCGRDERGDGGARDE